MQIVPTWVLDNLIDDGQGATTIDALRTAQLDALPYECPLSGLTGLIEIPAAPGSEELVKIPCPLCAGMGKTLVEYTFVPDTGHWTPTPPPPPDGTIE